MAACPRDRGELRPHPLQRHAAQRCTKCAGLWIPAPVVAQALGRVPKPRSLAVSDHSILRCPQDQSLLSAVHYQGVELDVCGNCGGVWLDAGELEQILQRRCESRQDEVDSSNADDSGIADQLLDGAGDAVGAVLEFFGEALSGL